MKLLLHFYLQTQTTDDFTEETSLGYRDINKDTHIYIIFDILTM